MAHFPYYTLLVHLKVYIYLAQKENKCQPSRWVSQESENSMLGYIK